jgi:hypothetical protein
VRQFAAGPAASTIGVNFSKLGGDERLERVRATPLGQDGDRLACHEFAVLDPESVTDHERGEVLEVAFQAQFVKLRPSDLRPNSGLATGRGRCSESTASDREAKAARTFRKVADARRRCSPF